MLFFWNLKRHCSISESVNVSKIEKYTLYISQSNWLDLTSQLVADVHQIIVGVAINYSFIPRDNTLQWFLIVQTLPSGNNNIAWGVGLIFP